MTLPKILRQPSTKIKNSKKSQVSYLLDLYNNKISVRDIDIEKEFDIVKTLYEGSFSRIHLAHKLTHPKERVVIKVIPQKFEDFYRELNYNYFLSPHPNVVKCYNVSIIWEDSYVFPMEYAPWGNLARFISQESWLSETLIKSATKQLASAIDFMHSLKLVHRDISPENVLVFKEDLSQIKLSDFGSTRPEKSLVVCIKPESCKTVSKLPPEVCHLVTGESYYVRRSSDTWQMGMLIYGMLTGGAEPWQAADDISDPSFYEWVQWLRRKNLRVPEQFQIFTPRMLRLFKRLFEPKPRKRCEAKEVSKYLEDDWILSLCRGTSFRRVLLERKASSSTNRSLSSGTRSRNSSLKRKSFRNSLKSNSVRLNQLSEKEGRASPEESCAKISGSGRDKMGDIDKDFVKERVGQWISTCSQASLLQLK